MKKISFNAGWLCDGKKVTLPHDAMLEGGRDKASKGGSALGYYQGGSYVYTRTFMRPEGKHVEFLFEGVYRRAQVFINGKKAGGCAYGYTEFYVDATPFLTEGENTIEVHADNSEVPNSRFYTGSGIYRPVWMLTGGDAYIKDGGIHVTTVSLNPAQIEVKVDAVGAVDGEIEVEIYDGEHLAASGEPGLFRIPDAVLWSDEDPHLYRCCARLKRKSADSVWEEAEVTFGIRKLSWDGKGFYVNGVRTMLRGGCIHHDNGILGACAYREADWRKIRLLKQAGYNAIRSAHNPCSRGILDACDYYGIYVMDESWDMWFQRKTRYDYALDFRENWKTDLKAMVEKDYNHPCVAFYSIGNEVSEPALDEGLSLAREMTDFVHKLDPSRAVTGGYNLMLIQQRAKKGSVQYSEEDPKTEPMNSSLMFNKMASIIGTGMNKSSGTAEVDQIITPLMEIMDIAGYNYASGRYEKDLVLHPDRLIIGTETFPQDIVKNWETAQKQPNLAGDFMWTAIDYLGEAGIGAWAYTEDGRTFNKPYPWVLGDVGALDLLGNPTGEIYLANAAWHQLDGPRMTVQPVNHPGVQVARQTWRGTNGIPSWSWKGCEGNKAVVEVYTESPVVLLFLNGKRVGKKRTKGKVASFQITYRPGTLEAVALDGRRKETGRCRLVSAGETHIGLHPEKKSAAPGEVVFVPVSLEDAQGVTECNADRRLQAAVEGGELLGFGSANPRTTESFTEGACTTYYGRALAAVRCGTEIKTVIRVTDEQGNQTAQEIAVDCGAKQ